MLDRGTLRSLQDLGAAGLSSSSSEMASKGEVGLDIDIASVPLREADMEPFEIMVSESQERMLCVVEPDQLDAVLGICARWEVRATVIGEVTDSRHLRVFDGEELVGDMPVEALVDDCPLYDLEPAEPAEPVYPDPPRRLADDAQPEQALLALLAAPSIASKRFVFEQYDSIVGSRTVRRPGSADAAVLQLAPDGGSGAIALSIDGNGRRVACDPYTGAVEAVLECARNLACVGAEPLGLTNCLNFGNPEKAHVAWQLTRAVEGLRDACLALGVPVVGGNVSLYNEGAEGPIYPSPIVGMVGKLPDPACVPGMAFAEEGHAIALVGPFAPALAGSELEKLHGRLARGLPAVDLAAQAAALRALCESVRAGGLASVHDISEGGLACALAECCIAGAVGAQVQLPAADPATLFGEGPGGVLIAGPREQVEAIDGAAIIGQVGGPALEIEGVLSLPVAELTQAYESTLPAAFSPS
ncbi:MAG TPA: AIR synthase-related protein [Thermoleophilaceae bacterium]|nr:AIR synthase-related protein [Thermoleophilaceae bacterium]